MPQPVAKLHYAVYHAHDPWAMLFPREDRWLHNQALNYRHVADMQADELEQVFALTNHQEESWTSHPEITWHATDTLVRSTSVGDVIVSMQTEQAWLVMSAGFSAILPPTALSVTAG